MFEFLVGLVLTALVAIVIVVGVIVRDTVFCRRRDTFVRIVDGRCEHRATACADAPAECESECVKLTRSAA
jgi:hypothetical protein